MELFSKACGHLKRKQEYKVWQDGYHTEIIDTEKFLIQKLNDIHQNPVVDRIVDKPEDYRFSLARHYAGLDSELDVFVLPKRLVAYG